MEKNLTRESHDFPKESGDVPVEGAFTETKNPRQEVVDALNNAYDCFISFPDHNLTDAQKADRDHLKEVKENTIDKNKGSRRIRFKGTDGTEYSEQEYLPLDTLINFLRERIKSGSLTEEETETHRRLERTLHGNAKEYYRTSKKRDILRKQARIDYETKRVSSDVRLSTGNPHDDDLLAGNILFRRRELVLPSATQLPPPPDDPYVPLPPEPDPPREAPNDTTLPPDESEPTPSSPENTRREIAVINRTIDIKKRASELAEEHLRDEQRRGSAFNPLNWARKTRLRVLEEYYRQRFITEASTKMIEANNSYLSLDIFKNAAADASFHKPEEEAAGKAKIEQVRTDESLEGQKTEVADEELKNLIFDEIVSKIVDGEIKENSQVQKSLREFIKNNQDNPQIKELFGPDSTKYGILANYFASDLLETGKLLLEDKKTHNYSMERLKELTTIKLANASWAAETQTQWTLADKAIAWSQKNKKGFLTNPAIVGALTSIGVYGGMRSAGMSGRALLAAPIAGGLLGATFAGLRRAHDLKVDRAAHQIEKEYGTTTPEGAKRRKRLDEYEYETVSFDTLLSGGQDRENVFGDSRGIKELMGLDVSPESINYIPNREALLRRAAEIKARLDYGAREGKGLITYERKEAIEQNRLLLIKAVAEAKVKLKNAGMDESSINTRLTELQGQWSEQFTKNAQDQDRAFNIYRVRSSLMSAGIGGATGLAVGLGATSAARGLLELAGKNTHISGLENMSAVNNIFGKTKEAKSNIAEALRRKNPAKVGDLTIIPLNEGGVSIKLPDGERRQVPKSQITEEGHIKVGGEIQEDLRDELRLAGFEVVDETKTVQGSIINESTPLVRDDLFGKKIMIPEGTEWIQDTQSPDRWDLVVSDHPDNTLIKGIHLSVDGEITYDSSLSAFGEEAITANQELTREASEEIHHITGPEGMWEKETTQISGREWYAYDTPQSDHNELRAYNSVFDAGDGLKGVEWDMSHMKLGYQSGLNPNPIDVQQTIKNGQAGFAFTLPDNPQNSIWVSDLSDGKADGKIRLDPNDFTNRINSNNPNSMTVGEFSRIILNQEKLATLPEGNLSSEVYGHRDIFRIGKAGKMGFIEAGRLVDRDGGKILQTFATAGGEHEIPESITTKTDAEYETVLKIPPKPYVNTEEITVTELIPPIETSKDFEIPIVPTPISPRLPLEKMLLIYGYGGEYSAGNLGLIDRNNDDKEYKNRRSKRLLDNPNALLNEKEEVEEYINSFPAEYKEELEALNATLPAMKDSCRIVITIPAYKEGKIIYDSISHFLNQKSQNGTPVDPNLYEFIIVDNRPLNTQKDQTESEIQRFKTSYPNMNIHYVGKVWEEDESACVGNARKYANDLAILRNSERAGPNEDLILVSFDADVDGVNDKYITNIIKEFDNKPSLDAAAGKWNLPSEALAKPNLRAGQRLWYLLDRLLQKDAEGPISSRRARLPGLVGRNTAFRSSIYAAVGGYNPNAKLAEDLEMGWMIDAARGYDSASQGRTGYINRAEVISNPRRFLAAITQNTPLLKMYGGFHESTQIRDLDNSTLLAQIPDRFDVKMFEKEADALWQASVNGQYSWSEDRFAPIFTRLMHIMGAEYKVENNHVIITNAEKLEEKLSHYN